MSRKTRAARLSIYSNSTLIVLNTIVGIISGSVSIISEAIHTVVDLLAAIMAYFAVKLSDTPPDEKHPYGHGKIENISGVIEALLIFVASGWIIYEAVHKIMNPEPLADLGLGLGFLIMLFAAVLNFFVSRHLYKVARETDSIALEADALHLKTHVYTSAGIAVAMILIWLTNWHFLDSIAAIVVALIILKEAVEILIIAFKPLIDATLPEKEIELIRAAISKHMRKETSFHQLRTRKAGPYKYADFHLELPEDCTVKSSHELCDRIETEIKKSISNIEVTIHVEPKGIHK